MLPKTKEGQLPWKTGNKNLLLIIVKGVFLKNKKQKKPALFDTCHVQEGKFKIG